MFGVIHRPLYKPVPRLVFGGEGVETSLPTTLGSKTDEPVSTLVTSRLCYPGVIGAVSITAGTGEYSIDGGAWTSVAGNFVTGLESFQARQTSSASSSTLTDLVFSIGAGTDTFSVTTVATEAVYWEDINGDNILDLNGDPIEVL